MPPYTLTALKRAGLKLAPLTRSTPLLARSTLPRTLHPLARPTTLTTLSSRALSHFPGYPRSPGGPPGLWKPILAVTTVSVVGLVLLPPLLVTLLVAGMGFMGYRFLQRTFGSPGSAGLPFQDPRVAKTLWDNLFSASSISTRTQNLLYEQAVRQTQKASLDLGTRMRVGRGVDESTSLRFSPPLSVASGRTTVRENGRLRESSTMILRFDLEGPYETGTIMAQGEIDESGEDGIPTLQALQIQWHRDGLVEEIPLGPKDPSQPLESSSQGHIFQGEFRPAEPPSSSRES
ncbi:hypothetical protein BJ684DRAFT_18524 [Piptocephalis cylindrospora]|uniref:Uncharacterized protein n=1 Tax=Piptocephalis cylindrospora TaxID=1907219 RepID=A0A4P9Y9M1_9FUNG|nr:hypothetical protein BJ684DRAFT_18524 [Piptocephalis cylindrospora]|eukprot:RKP15131.1 hypothetical protein BJ684DRAFT_18524 [Piptocephalis cylindrospora]